MTSFMKGLWRLLKRFAILGYNKKRNIFGMNPLLISTCFIILTTIIASLLRIAIKKAVNDGVVKHILLEFVATAELCAICFELIVVADNYGVWVYALFLFLLTLRWARAWEVESACPYTELEKVVEGTQPYKTALMIVAAQLLGGILVYYYVSFLWSLELTETHRGKSQEECKADLQKPLLRHFLTEVLGVFISTFPKRYMIKCCDPYAVPLSIAWDIVFGLLGKVFHVGSIYFNAALGSAFGVKCMPFVNIIAVHWIGSNLGALCAFSLIKRMRCITMLSTQSSLNRQRNTRMKQENLLHFQVSAAIGTAIEGFFTCLCRLASRLLNDSNARFGTIADPFFATMMVVAAFNYSGGYFNPALATSLKGGCEGHTYVEFIMVYWVGACSGAVASIYCYNSDSFQHFAQKLKPKIE